MVQNDTIKATKCSFCIKTKMTQIYEMFNKENTEAVLMVDSSNAFNAINREAFVHDMKILCPSISTFISNCYLSPTDLHIQGG